MLQKCISLKKTIEEELSRYEFGEETPLLDELPVVTGTSLTSYISDLKRYILPQLEYIILCLEKRRPINKNKIHLGHYVVHECSLNATLGTMLLEIERILLKSKK